MVWSKPLNAYLPIFGHVVTLAFEPQTLSEVNLMKNRHHPRWYFWLQKGHTVCILMYLWATSADLSMLWPWCLNFRCPNLMGPLCQPWLFLQMQLFCQKVSCLQFCNGQVDGRTTWNIKPLASSGGGIKISYDYFMYPMHKRSFGASFLQWFILHIQYMHMEFSATMSKWLCHCEYIPITGIFMVEGIFSVEFWEAFQTIAQGQSV